MHKIGCVQSDIAGLEKRSADRDSKVFHYKYFTLSRSSHELTVRMFLASYVGVSVVGACMMIGASRQDI